MFRFADPDRVPDWWFLDINQRHDLMDEFGTRLSREEMMLFIRTCDISCATRLNDVLNTNSLSSDLVNFAYSHLDTALLDQFVPYAKGIRPCVKLHTRAFCALLSFFEPTDDEIVKLAFYDLGMLKHVRELYPRRFLATTTDLSARISEHIGPNWLFHSDERRGELTQALMATNALPSTEMSSLVHNLMNGGINEAVARFGLSEKAYALSKLFVELAWTDEPIPLPSDYRRLVQAEHEAVEHAKQSHAQCHANRVLLANNDYSLIASRIRMKEHIAAQQVDRQTKRAAYAEQWLTDWLRLSI
jgi:hypothetical protein